MYVFANPAAGEYLETKVTLLFILSRISRDIWVLHLKNRNGDCVVITKNIPHHPREDLYSHCRPSQSVSQ